MGEIPQETILLLQQFLIDQVEPQQDTQIKESIQEQARNEVTKNLAALFSQLMTPQRQRQTCPTGTVDQLARHANK